MLRSILLGAVATAISTLSLQAQCLDANTGTAVGTGDDIVLGAQTLGFSFPFNGSTFTTVHPCTNGFVYLGNGSASTDPQCCSGDVIGLTTAASPMIAAWWADLNITGGGVVKFSAQPGKAVVTWENAQEYFNSSPFTVQLQLFSTGEIVISYDNRVEVYNNHDFLVGMSQGGSATAPAATDFSVVGTSTTTTNFQLFGPNNGPTSLTGKGVQFLPNAGTGYTWVPTACFASHTSYGTGCYDLPPQGFYQDFTDAALAQAGLQGNAMLLVPSGGSYAANWLPGTASAFYVAPTAGATSLPADDDGDSSYTLTTPLATPGGPVTQLTISHNGIVTLGAIGNNSFNFSPNGTDFSTETGGAFYSWHDWNDAEAGSGALKTEEIGGVLYVTWDNVESYPGGSSQPGTMQFQFNLATGTVTYVWVAISNDTTSIFGSNHLVGYKGLDSITDPGSSVLATSLPGSFRHNVLLPLTLSATPAPVSTPTSGTVITFTTDNIPELVPSSGLYVALHILSLGQVPAPGLDLGFLGAPGCAALVQSLDFTQSMVGITSTQSVTFSLPAGVPTGLQLYSQSAALITPNSLPNGQNAFGLTTSNGIASAVNVQ